MKFSTVQWITWVGAAVAAAVGLSAFAFTQFETKMDSMDKRTAIEKRLDRIEGKVDVLVSRRR